MNNKCELCGKENATEYNLSTTSGNVSRTMFVCGECFNDLSAHSRNYIVKHNSILNKRWERIFSNYCSNIKRNGKDLSYDEIENKFWKERLAMFCTRTAKPESYIVKLFIEKFLRDMSIADVMSRVSMLLRDPDSFEDEIRKSMDRKQREMEIS